MQLGEKANGKKSGSRAKCKNLLCFILPVFLGGLPVAAQEEENPFRFEAEVGVRYDDNITVDQSDNTSRRGDESLLFRASFGLDFLKKKKNKLSARYSFFQSLHDELSDFDLQIHGLSLRAKTKVGKVNVAADYRFNFIRLGNDDFLEIHNIRPNIGLTIAKNTYLTASYEFRDLKFKDVSLLERNAQRHSGASKVFFLLGKGKNITLGYKVSRHEAQTDALSYWGHTVDSGLKLPFNVASKRATYRLRYQYRQKDYSGIHALIGAKRADKRHTMRTSVRLPIGKELYAEVEYKYVISNSNLASIDYDNHIVTTNLGWSF